MTSQQSNPIKLSTFWPYQVSVLADQISRHTVRIAKEEAGLNLSQWRVLAAVAEKPGRSSASVVAVTPMDKGIVSRAVHTLIDLGLITKTTDHGDKRRYALTLTSTGNAHYSSIAARLNKALIAPFDDMGAQHAFVSALESYIQHMQSLQGDKSQA